MKSDKEILEMTDKEQEEYAAQRDREIILETAKECKRINSAKRVRRIEIITELSKQQNIRKAAGWKIDELTKELNRLL